ncbi:hypothetical protein SAMN05421690_10714 [Nitrosomonas sp. Nm51]|uniref:hypothetical protein n=1 Tax=Nitrosomonas sp. Nm51 TaxID=133720 RepID=UPI0008B6F6C9|nr:hypothetical protein [Nitrosomonas sp. Nm51]SER76989.1 hypothetical protein SAMN05421690_10714 [Nitrosomonas sp. Nm51]
MSHSTSYGDNEQRRSVPARCDPGVTVIYERLLIIVNKQHTMHKAVVNKDIFYKIEIAADNEHSQHSLLFSVHRRSVI